MENRSLNIPFNSQDPASPQSTAKVQDLNTIVFATDFSACSEHALGYAAWLAQANAIVQREVGNTQFTVASWAYQLAISKSQLLRRLKSLTGLTPVQYIREVKLQKARVLLQGRAYPTVSEVAYAVGYQTPEYFSKRYAQRFGKRPKQYLNPT